MSDDINKTEETDKETVKEEKKASNTSKKVEELIAEIEKLSVLELADLVKALEEKFGVSAAPMAMAAPVAGSAPAAGQAADAGAGDQTTFNVLITLSLIRI